MTGYPSIDKPWKRYRPDAPIRNISTNQKLVTLIEDANSQNLDTDALSYLGLPGNTWTYRELFMGVERAARSFLKKGVKRGDVVLISTVSGPEEALCLLALNKIGAVSKWIDVTVSSNELHQAIIEDNCRIAVVFSVILPELEKCLSETNLSTVICVSPDQFIRRARIFRASPRAILKLLLSEKQPLPSMPNDSRFLTFSQFVNEGTGDNPITTVDYRDNEPAIIVQSSGTTGKPKSIVHSDASVNTSINKLAHSDLPLRQGLTILKTAPSWVAYGLINTLATGLALGMTVLLTPSLNENLLIDVNGKYDVCFGVPLHYRYLSAHLSEITEMRRPLALISGGDKISAQEIEQFEQELKQRECNARILNGAGCNEICGVGSVNFVEADKPGTIGVPLADDLVAAFDPDTLEELPYGETGEICYSTQSLFLGYARELEMTSEVRVKHADGRMWMHSRDLGFIDKEGFIHLQGRMSRIITVAAFKISAAHIEEVILTHPDVNDCVVVGAPDDELGEVPVAFLATANTDRAPDIIKQEVISMCRERLKDKAVPRHLFFMDELPYTSNKKQDYRLLEQQAVELISATL